MANSARFEILKRDEVSRQAQELGLRAPYDQIAKTRLAQALGASAIVEGVVEYVRDDAQTPLTVGAGLSVRVSEAATGDLLSGAAQVGLQSLVPGSPTAIRWCRKLLRTQPSNRCARSFHTTCPEGTVLNTVGTEPNVIVLINRGLVTAWFPAWR